MMKYLIAFILFVSFPIITDAQQDSLKVYYERSTGFKVYTYASGNTRLPLTGSNTMYSLVGSKFLFSGEAQLKGLLVAFAEKKKNVNNVHQIVAYHLDNQGNMPSGQALGVGNFYLDDITANKDKPVFTWLPFNQKVPIVSGNFGVMVMTRTALSNDDFISIFSNLQGDGQGMRTSFDLYAGNGGEFVYENLYDFPVATDAGGNPDIDVMIVPVLDYSNSAGSQIDYGGLKILKAFCNPVQGVFQLALQSDFCDDISFWVIDINGRELHRAVKQISQGVLETIEFRTDNLSAGMYFYIIRGSRAKFSGIITK